jgi:Trk K+ transport system NAD-binding subunit
LIPALGGLVVGPLIYFFARETKGHGVPEVMAAVALRGRTTRELDIGAKTGVQAVLLRKRGAGGAGREVRVPNADDRIDEGDRLVIAGTRSAVEAMDVI